MRTSKLYFIILLFICTTILQAQQIADVSYDPPYFKPAYDKGKGTFILIDEAHNNFHTASGRYSSFADLLIKDGFNIKSNRQNFSTEALKDAKVLVIANALHPDNLSVWRLPTPSAFTEQEISEVNSWVKNGGSLFLIADHMPFAGAAMDLAKSFGFTFYNGFAFDTVLTANLDIFTRASGTLLSNEITNNQVTNSTIDSIATFTGQAFDIPQGATSIIKLNERFKIFLSKQAWQFDSGTTKIEANGKSQGAYMLYGKGKIVVFGEAAMFTSQLAGGQKVGMNSPKAKNNYALLVSIVRWLTK